MKVAANSEDNESGAKSDKVDVLIELHPTERRNAQKLLWDLE